MGDTQQGDGLFPKVGPVEAADQILTLNLQTSVSPEMPLTAQAPTTGALSRQELREQRLNELLESCRVQTLAQIVGPFGLTPAMFKDKDGGSVTTTHNFEQGVTATADDAARHGKWKKAQDSIDRTIYDTDLGKKRKTRFKNPEPLISAATGKELSRDGSTHFDHTISVAEFERSSRAQLYMEDAIRVHTLNDPNNLRPMESSINQSMSDKNKIIWANQERKKDPGKTNAESFAVDVDLIRKNNEESERFVWNKVIKSQIEKQGREVYQTSVEEMKRNALRQAVGVLLHEFVNSSYLEVKAIVVARMPSENLVDRISTALERTVQRVTDKMQDAFDALISGGVQGIVSNLLTFIINNFITTSAKIVKVIRESMSALWQAFTVLISPPEHMSEMEVARVVSKLIAGVITTSLGIYFETTINAAVAAVPVLAPIAGILSPAITGLLTGLATALTIYAIDRVFDWLADPGTEMLNAQIGVLDAQGEVAHKLGDFMEQQYANSGRYQDMIVRYQVMARDLSIADGHLQAMIAASDVAIEARSSTISMMSEGLEIWERDGNELSQLISEYKIEE